MCKFRLRGLTVLGCLGECKKLKNVQIIDGAQNCTYDIYAFPDDVFDLIFPEPGQDIEFIEDFIDRDGSKIPNDVWAKIWESRVDKPDVVGIHGTLFYELRDQKKKYYPDKRDEGMIVVLPGYDEEEDDVSSTDE